MNLINQPQIPKKPELNDKKEGCNVLFAAASEKNRLIYVSKHVL